MDVKHFLRVRAYGFHDARPERQIGYEVPVHDIYMHPVASTIVYGTNFVSELCKIGGQDRWCDQDFPGHVRASVTDWPLSYCARPGGTSAAYKKRCTKLNNCLALQSHFRAF